MRAVSRECLDVSKDSKPENVSSQSADHSLIPVRRTELPSSEPPKTAPRRSGKLDTSITLAVSGSNEAVRIRSRRRTTENITRLPEASTSSLAKSNRTSCTWPYEIHENNNLERTSSAQSLKSSCDSESQRDISQYLDDNEKSRKFTKQEEEELDNVQKNIRHIHRRSLTESVQVHKLKHLDKFESGAAFSNQLDRQPSSKQLNGSRSPDRSHSPSTRGSRESSASHASPGRSHASHRDHHLSDSDRSTSSGVQAPSAKIKNKTKIHSLRAKSPPPETMDDDDDYLDTFVKKNLEQSLSDESSNSNNAIEKNWKHVSSNLI
ncbi:hypothetical protein LSH36_129g01041 [Paralvinella palmiformis]|uniref:Uncharacterized protein n=1 Tax=Paralvinella palmiformis TaxID=53620 RepID=A0AAD9JY37_9ANNE|nr:hypothetical protein LSH36_129g01041 [Paralvinella palmiformis]